MSAPAKPTLPALPAEIRFKIWNQVILDTIDEFKTSKAHPHPWTLAHQIEAPKEALKEANAEKDLVNPVKPFPLISKNIKSDVQSVLNHGFPTGRYLPATVCCRASATRLSRECPFVHINCEHEDSDLMEDGQCPGHHDTRVCLP